MSKETKGGNGCQSPEPQTLRQILDMILFKMLFVVDMD